MSGFNVGGSSANVNALSINFSDGTVQSTAAVVNQHFFVDYTFNPTDATNGYAFIACPLPHPYPDANYLIQVTLQNNNTEGGWLTLGYVGGDGVAHGAAPTPNGFSVVLLNINGTGIVAGQTVRIHCTTTHQ